MLEDKMHEETPEEVFFKYSIPCSHELLKLGSIDDETRKKVLDYTKKHIAPERTFLEQVYPAALKRIEKVAQELGVDKWNVLAIRKYFLEEHNRVIDRKEGNYSRIPEKERELCKVRVGTVVGIEVKLKTVIYRIDYGDKLDIALGTYYSDAKIGDKISTHWKVAVEGIRNNENPLPGQ